MRPLPFAGVAAVGRDSDVAGMSATDGSFWQCGSLLFLRSGRRRAPREDPATEPDPDSAIRGRPRRILRQATRRIIIRREMTSAGYVLRFTGKYASGALMDLVLDEIEQMFAPG